MLPTFILALHAYVTSSLSISGKNIQGIVPITMLEYLLIHNISVAGVKMEDIADIKCQLCHLHLEHYLFQQKYDQIFRHLC